MTSSTSVTPWTNKQMGLAWPVARGGSAGLGSWCEKARGKVLSSSGVPFNRHDLSHVL